MTLTRLIVVAAVLICGSTACGSTDGKASSAPSSSDPATETVQPETRGEAGGGVGGASPAELTSSDTPMETEEGDWQLYRDDRFGLAFQYPEIYELRVRDDGSGPADLLLRIGLLTPDAVGSPIEDRIPPAFAVDVYDNSAGRSLDEWMVAKGRAADGSRYTASAVTIDGLEGVRVTDSAAMAPNVFCYVGKGEYVYRFTPLGNHAEQILESVELDP